MGSPYRLGRPTILAQTLRNNATDAERRLWKHLRGSQLGGHKFSRQMPVAGYICDFVCRSERLVVELDGGQHGWQTEQDDARTRKLEAAGYRVIRFWNNDVIEGLDGVLLEVARSLAGEPTPDPSRKREGSRDA